MGSNDVEFNTIREESLTKILTKTKYSDSEAEVVIKEYKVFKERLHKFSNMKKEKKYFMRLHEHLLYATQEWLYGEN